MLPAVTVEGRLVAEPSLRFAPSGVAVCDFRLVASKRKQNDAGEWVDDKTLWLACTAFRQLAENIAESCVKSENVIVMGRLETQEWTDEKTSEKRSRTVMLVDALGVSLRFRTVPHGAGKAERTSAPATGDAWSGGGASTTTVQDDAPPF